MRMRKKIAVLVLTAILCFAASAVAEGDTVSIAAGLGEQSDLHTFSIGAATQEAFVLCEAYMHEYYGISREGEVRRTSSLTDYDPSRPSNVYLSPLALAAEGNELFAVNMTVQQDSSALSFTGAGLYRLDREARVERKVCDLDLKDAIRSDGSNPYVLSCRGALKSENMLFLLFELESGFDAADCTCLLLGCDVSNGRMWKKELGGILQLVSYAEGELICARAAPEANATELVSLNPENHDVKTLCRLEGESGRPRNVVTDAERGQVFYTVNNQVWGLQTSEGAPQQIAALPFRDPMGLFRMDSDTLCVFSNKNAQIFPIDWDFTIERSRLVVSGDSALLMNYALLHPEIEVVNPNEASPEEVVQAVLSRSPTPDVFAIESSSQIYAALRERGFLLPLEDRLQEYARQLHPDIREAILVDGEICALPVGMQIDPMLGVNEALWNELNLGTIPASWPEFVSFLQAWPEHAKEHPDICLFNVPEAQHIQMNLEVQAIQDYESHRQSCGEGIGYDTDRFRNLMNSLNGVDYAELVFEGQVSDTNKLLMQWGYDPGLYFDMEPFCAMPLAVSQDVPAVLSANLSILAVNPFSENIEIINGFLNYAMENTDAVAKIEMQPGENTPIQLDGLDEALREYDHLIKGLEQAVLDADDDASLNLALQKEEAIRARDELLADPWYVSPERIRQYRSATGRLSIPNNYNSNDATRDALRALRIAYAQREIDLETLINNAGRMIEMQYRENQ